MSSLSDAHPSLSAEEELSSSLSLSLSLAEAESAAASLAPCTDRLVSEAHSRTESDAHGLGEGHTEGKTDIPAETSHKNNNNNSNDNNSDNHIDNNDNDNGNNNINNNYSKAGVPVKSQEEVDKEVFVGDLSFFCREYHLHQLFSSFGRVLGARIRRSETTHQSLMYGFVKMSSTEEARVAAAALADKLFMGRELRVQLCNIDGHPSQYTPKYGFQLHVSFISHREIRTVVTESFLRRVFEPYGPVVDALLTRHTLSREPVKQSGYGFVYMAAEQGAVAAIAALRNAEIQGIKFDCSISHRSLAGGKRASDPQTLQAIQIPMPTIFANMNYNNNSSDNNDQSPTIAPLAAAATAAAAAAAAANTANYAANNAADGSAGPDASLSVIAAPAPSPGTASTAQTHTQQSGPSSVAAHTHRQPPVASAISRRTMLRLFTAEDSHSCSSGSGHSSPAGSPRLSPHHAQQQQQQRFFPAENTQHMNMQMPNMPMSMPMPMPVPVPVPPPSPQAMQGPQGMHYVAPPVYSPSMFASHSHSHSHSPSPHTHNMAGFNVNTPPQSPRYGSPLMPYSSPVWIDAQTMGVMPTPPPNELFFHPYGPPHTHPAHTTHTTHPTHASHAHPHPHTTHMIPAPPMSPHSPMLAYHAIINSPRNSFVVPRLHTDSFDAMDNNNVNASFQRGFRRSNSGGGASFSHSHPHAQAHSYSHQFDGGAH